MINMMKVLTFPTSLQTLEQVPVLYIMTYVHIPYVGRIQCGIGLAADFVMSRTVYMYVLRPSNNVYSLGLLIDSVLCSPFLHRRYVYRTHFSFLFLQGRSVVLPEPHVSLNLISHVSSTILKNILSHTTPWLTIIFRNLMVSRHHEVPLTELTGGTDSKDRRGSVRTPQIERKKRATTKTKLAFESQTLANSHKDIKEELNDSSPKANFNPGFNETFEEPAGDQIGSPIQCKSPEGFTSDRSFISSTPTDEFIGGNHVGAIFDGANAVDDDHRSENASGDVNAEACIPVSFTPSAGDIGDEDRPSAQSAPWIEAMLPRLHDMRRLRKSLGSALRVKVDGSAQSTGTERKEAGDFLFSIFNANLGTF